MSEYQVKCRISFEGETGLVEQIGEPSLQIVPLFLEDMEISRDTLAKRVAETVLARNDHFGFTPGTIQVRVALVN